MRACEICSSISPIWQGNTLDGAAESILAECVVNVFENENIVCTVRGRRRQQLEGGKRDAAALEMLGHNVEARGRKKLEEALTMTSI